MRVRDFADSDGQGTGGAGALSPVIRHRLRMGDCLLTPVLWLAHCVLRWEWSYVAERIRVVERKARYDYEAAPSIPRMYIICTLRPAGTGRSVQRLPSVLLHSTCRPFSGDGAKVPARKLGEHPEWSATAMSLHRTHHRARLATCEWRP